MQHVHVALVPRSYRPPSIGRPGDEYSKVKMAMNVPGPFSNGIAVPTQLWTHGPSPGSLYQFPAGHNSSQAVQLPVTHTLRPMVTGTSVLGMTFADGIMLAADKLGSYGSMARFRDISRVMKVTESCVVAASGDYADFQYLQRLLEYLTIDSDSLDDGHSYTPKSVFSWLTRVMYNRRTKINPLWNTVIVGGYHEEKPFLGYVNSLGTAFEAPSLATGFGSYIAQPLLRDAYEKNPSMTKEEAREVMERCLKVLYYRDGRALNKYEIAVISSEGVEILGPLTHETNWDIAHYVRGYD